MDAFSTAEYLNASVAHFVAVYGLPVIFLGVLFLGEAVILASFILSGHGVVPFGMVFVLCATATLAADVFWFLVSRYFPENFVHHAIVAKSSSQLREFLDRHVEHRIFLSILFLKFFIGTRLIILIYLGRQQISFFRFVVYDVLGVIIFVGILSVIGWLFGAGLYNLLPTYTLFTKIVFAVLAIMFLLFLFKRVYRTYVVAP